MIAAFISAFINALAVSLALTILLETTFFYLTGMRDKRDLALLWLVNVLTNPLVVAVYWLMAARFNGNPYLIQISLESLAVLTEGKYYKKYGRGFTRPYLFAFGANAFSFGMGILLQRLLR